jgi:Gpi18-like mannosyltransferase
MELAKKVNYPSQVHWMLYALLYILLLLLTPNAGFTTDVVCWTGWTMQIGAHGLTKAYDNSSNNYNPLYQYVLYVFAKLAGSPARIAEYVHWLKAFTLLFDFGGAILVVRYFGWGDNNQRFILSLLFLCNIGYLYNTVVWEQVDAILSTLLFASLVQALRQRPVSSALYYLLAINMKSQGVMLLPPMLLLWVPQWRVTPRSLVQSTALGLMLQLLILAPFIWSGAVVNIAHLIYDAASYFPYASMNCYNMWAYVIDSFTVHDSSVFWGITYKRWGLFSFLLASAVVLLPLGLVTLQKLRTRQLFGSADYQLVLLSMGLIPVACCFFNTQMHERYWHPALLLLGAHALLTQRYWLFGLFSLAYFLNMEGVMNYLLPNHFPAEWLEEIAKQKVANYLLPDDQIHISLLFNPKLVASLFGVVLLGGIWQLYRTTSPWAVWQQLRKPLNIAVAVPAEFGAA